MPDPTPRDLALAEFTALERPRWSNADWPRVLEAGERLLDSLLRFQVRAALTAPTSPDEAPGE